MMTKSTANAGSVSAHAEQIAVQEITRLLAESRDALNMRTAEHFTMTLDIWLATLRQISVKPMVQTIPGLELGLAPLQQALDILKVQAQENYLDIIGLVYMVVGQNEKNMGQYFTPYDVATLMVEIKYSGLKPQTSREKPLKIYEPACGSGVFLLAAAETIEKRCPGMITRGEARFFGDDLDAMCIKMAQIIMRDIRSNFLKF
jgi:hypothetical protein